MRYLLPDAVPIVPDCDWEARIAFPNEFWSFETLESGVLTAAVRLATNGALVANLSTADGTIRRETPTNLVLVLAASQTSMTRAVDCVVFSFVRNAPGSTRAIPGRWSWPVQPQVPAP